jgi:hypothetical protein
VDPNHPPESLAERMAEVWRMACEVMHGTEYEPDRGKHMTFKQFLALLRKNRDGFYLDKNGAIRHRSTPTGYERCPIIRVADVIDPPTHSCWWAVRRNAWATSYGSSICKLREGVIKRVMYAADVPKPSKTRRDLLKALRLKEIECALSS